MMPLEPLIGPTLGNSAFAEFDRTTGPTSNFLANRRNVLSAMTGLKAKMLQLIGLKKRFALSSKTSCLTGNRGKNGVGRNRCPETEGRELGFEVAEPNP
jgi:hypothetical protein